MQTSNLWRKTMRKLSWILVAAVVALAAAGVAVAHGFGGKSVDAVAGSFSATQVTDKKTWTCTNDAGTWTRTVATYTGSASGDAGLAGPVKLRVESVLNTSKDVGLVEGQLRIDTAGRDTTARFTGVYQGGKVAGLAVGNAQEPRTRVVANVSASFTPDGGFSNGKLGGGTEGGAAVAVGRGDCKPAKPVKPPKVIVRANGTVTANSTSSLTIRYGKNELTAKVSASLATTVAQLSNGDKVSIVAARIDDEYTLVAIHKRR
jgi:hypothetical protein